MSAVAEEDDRVASRRRTVMTLKGWGPTVRRIDRDGEKNEKSLRCYRPQLMIATKRSLAKASIDPEFTSWLNSEGLEVMSTDKRWMTSPH
jgi:hypothetical protein